MRAGLLYVAVLLALVALPACASARAPDELIVQLDDLSRATFGLTDDQHFSMDCLRVAQVPGRPFYLGVYHHQDGDRFTLLLARSRDLRAWHQITSLGSNRTMGDLVALRDGGWLLADELSEPHSRSRVEVRHFDSLRALLAARSDRTFRALRTLSATNEGTPTLEHVVWHGKPRRSHLMLGLHYLSRAGVDRNARATLTDFKRWRARNLPTYNRAFDDHGVHGNLGGRARFLWGGRAFQLQEGQSTPGEWGSWRIYLRVPSTKQITVLHPQTPGGSTSFGNPAAAAVTLPDGRRALVFAAFLFVPGACPGEAGEMLDVIPATGS